MNLKFNYNDIDKPQLILSFILILVIGYILFETSQNKHKNEVYGRDATKWKIVDTVDVNKEEDVEDTIVAKDKKVYWFIKSDIATQKNGVLSFSVRENINPFIVKDKGFNKVYNNIYRFYHCEIDTAKKLILLEPKAEFYSLTNNEIVQVADDDDLNGTGEWQLSNDWRLGKTIYDSAVSIFFH